MSADRINEIIPIGLRDVCAMTAAFDPSLRVLSFSRMGAGQSNTGCKVETDKGPFLLKLYSKPSDGIERAMYGYLKDQINVPEMYFCDRTKSKFPFAYAVIEFIHGMTLAEYLRANGRYPAPLARDIGKTCAAIHAKRYPNDGALDEDLRIVRPFPGAYDKLTRLLDGRPATFLKPETVAALRDFALRRRDQFDRLDERSVLCHGDFNYWNLMISGEKTYAIDFEFAYAGTPYHDIGHFFRSKSENIQSLITPSVYAAFKEGYDAVSASPLPADWLSLARLCDIGAMLCLFNNEHFPAEWVDDIEADILSAVSEGAQTTGRTT